MLNPTALVRTMCSGRSCSSSRPLGNNVHPRVKKVGQAVPPVIFLLSRQAEPPVLPSRARSAGPCPVFGSAEQSGGDGVFFDIANNASEFTVIPNPVIPGFILPKRFTRQAQDSIRLARSRADRKSTRLNSS